ncbi:MAG: TIGR03032 family protein, partial [Actinobacteria bacterium]|nr:TIGR03032 family protein [Actinomycetota bacterium]
MSGSELTRLVFHEVDVSPGFTGWLAEHDVSIALTNGNRLFFVGRRVDGSLGAVEEQYGTCTALAPTGADTIYLSTRYQIWRYLCEPGCQGPPCGRLRTGGVGQGGAPAAKRGRTTLTNPRAGADSIWAGWRRRGGAQR